MRHYITPDDLPQNRLLDDSEAHWIYTQLDPSATRILSEGWQGVFRRTVLKCLPAPQLAQQFSEAFGRPTKEIYSMIGLLVIMEFKQWTAVVPPKVARPSRSGPLSDPERDALAASNSTCATLPLKAAFLAMQKPKPTAKNWRGATNKPPRISTF